MFVTLFLLTVVALALSLAFTPLVRSLALRWNFVDLPDNKRKVHGKPIPRIGGIAVGLAYFGSCLAALIILPRFSIEAHFGFSAIKAIAPATLLIFLVGVADDIFTLKAWQKFAVQILAAALVVTAGVHLGEFSYLTGYPALAKAVTIVWLVACTNAVNLIDGLDGLAGGIALLATITTLIASLMNGQVELTMATAPLAGALVGFLVFNFNPASIFLGDSGSLVLGFLLGCYGVLWGAKSPTKLGMIAPLMALSVPLLDTTLAVARRFLRSQPIFRPDRSHIHHRLLARGLTHRRAVLFLYVAGGIAGILSLSLIWARNQGEAEVLLIFACAAIFGIQELGYAEFEAAMRVLVRGGIRREIHAELAVRTFEQGLRAATTADDCWDVLLRASEEFGFHLIRMRLANRMFENGPEAMRSSAISIAISEDDWIELSLGTNTVQHPNALVPFATTIQQVLADKSVDVAFPRETEKTFSTVLYKSVPSTIH
jgi:UDP-GlcNAc:undecaprenyl-phosphate/decaprenyl-phosphate GlcNAc-1-phosphate transferase